MNPETIPTSNEAISESAPITNHHEATENPGFVTIKEFNEIKDMISSMLIMMKSSVNAASVHPVTEPVQQKNKLNRRNW